ncbi:MAG: hypothetical protein QXU50_03380 [Candidatus Korarchaeum sp.]
MIITLWLLRGKENIFTGIPMAFMITTTLAALVYLSYSGVTDYMRDPTKVGLGVASSMNITLMIWSVSSHLKTTQTFGFPPFSLCS